MVTRIDNIIFHDDGHWCYNDTSSAVYRWRWYDNKLLWLPTGDENKAYWIEWRNNPNLVDRVKVEIVDRIFEETVLKGCERD